MIQCADLLKDQKLLHAEECVSRCMVMVQNQGFACPQGPSLLLNFIHKVSPDFLIEELIVHLSLRYKVIMHQALVVKG